MKHEEETNKENTKSLTKIKDKLKEKLEQINDLEKQIKTLETISENNKNVIIK